MHKTIKIIDTKTYKTVSKKHINSMIRELPNIYCLSPYQLQLIADVYIEDLDKKKLAMIYNKIVIAINNRQKHL